MWVYTRVLKKYMMLWRSVIRQPLLMKFSHEWLLSRKVYLVVLSTCVESNLGLSWCGRSGLLLQWKIIYNLDYLSALCLMMWPGSKTKNVIWTVLLDDAREKWPCLFCYQGGDQLLRGSTENKPEKFRMKPTIWCETSGLNKYKIESI